MLFFVESGYFYNALKRYEKGWSEVVGLSYLCTEMTRNSVLCCCCYIHVTVVAIVMYGIFRFWLLRACVNEPSHARYRKRSHSEQVRIYLK